MPVAALTRIAEADGFRPALGLDRRAALWAVKGLPPTDLPLFAVDEGAEPPVTLPAMPVCEHVVADYQTLRLSLKAHPLRFLRRSLPQLKVLSYVEVPDTRNIKVVNLIGAHG